MQEIFIENAIFVVIVVIILFLPIVAISSQFGEGSYYKKRKVNLDFYMTSHVSLDSK